MRTLLSPRYLVRHLLTLLLVAGCLRLGWWQWDRARSVHGTLQNLGYAVQWPIFAGFVGYFWWKLIRPGAEPAGQPLTAQQLEEERTAALLRAPALGADERTAPLGEGPDEDPDDELAAYNRYLAELAERDAQRR